MAELELSVTICNWNTREDLRACLASLRAIAGEARFEVIVVDNASSDDSVSMITEQFPEVRLYALERNLGFTGGHNLALDERRAPDALLLNSDTIVRPGALRILIDYARSDSEAGLLGPKLLNPDGSLQYSCREFPNPVAAAFRNTVLGRLFPKNRYVRQYLMLDFAHEETRPVPWVSGAAIYATRACLEAIGPLDDRFFMFCEDVDWCRRTWDAGFKVVYVHDAVIVHAIGRSTDQAANRMIVLFHRAMLRYFAKHHITKIAWPLRPFAWAFAALALATRAGLFLAKNLWDEVGRRLRRGRS